MTGLLADVWQDLREKRLWPVAVALLVAIAAVPVLLRGPASPDSSGNPAGAVSPVASHAQIPALAGVEDLEEGSDLRAYDVKDPFRSGIKRLKSSGAGVALPIGGGSGGGTASAGGSSGGGATSGGSTVAGSSGPGGGATSGSGSSGGSSPSRPRTNLFTYVVDLTFGRRGSASRRNGVRRFAMLPSSRTPLIVFLGVSADRKKAVFLVDDSLSHSGEGACRPRVSKCSFLFLRTDDEHDEHFFTTDEGVEYVLKLRDIRAVRLTAKSSARASAARRGTRRPRPRLADSAN